MAMLKSLTQRLLAYAISPILARSDRQPPNQSAMVAAQRRILLRLVQRHKHLAFTQPFAFDRLPLGDDVRQAFAQQVPITTYNDYVAAIERVAAGEKNVLFPGAALALAQTSGTTSEAHAGERYIPHNKPLLTHHAQGGSAAFSRLITATGSHLFGGQSLMLGGSTTLTPNAHGIAVGDLSGIMAAQIPRWLRPFYAPGLDIALEPNWEKKLDRIVERYGQADIRLVTGIPSWCLMLFERLAHARGVTRACDAWPFLNGFIHGGHAINALLPSLRSHLAPDTWMMEVYPASEAFIAIVAEGPGANFFYEKDGVLYTPKLGNILPGITRQTVLEICSELDLKVEEKLFKPEDLFEADSAFFCGTAAEVIGIESIEGQKFSKPWKESMGAIIQKAYQCIVLDKSYSYVIV
jgi:hypothetical protein